MFADQRVLVTGSGPIAPATLILCIADVLTLEPTSTNSASSRVRDRCTKAIRNLFYAIGGC